MWGVAFLFLLKSCFFVCCCCLYFCSPGHEEGCILTQSSLPGFLFSPISHWRGAENRQRSTSPYLPAAVQRLLQIIPHQRWHITACLCVCCHAMLHTRKKGFRKTPKVFMFKRATHIKTASVSLTECSSFHQPVFGQDRTPRWHASPIYEGLVILDSSARRSAAGGYKHGVSVPLHSFLSVW